MAFGLGLAALAGIVLRFHHIGTAQFLFYDEGMYLGYNRAFLNLVANNPPHHFQELAIILSLMLKTALSTAKALWFFILSLRVFVFGPQAWAFARWVSAFSGLATVVVLYFWAGRVFKSQRIAILSALILLFLPSHVFYSRSGMQEALSTLLFLGAVYFYMLEARLRWPLFVSAFLLAAVYLTNYRMIIAPVFMAFIEYFGAFEQGTFQSKKHWQKLAVFAVVYGILILGAGSLYGGINLYVNFAWMFHQAQDAGGKFNPVNFISYPYDVFALEGIGLACFFWANLYLVKLKEYTKLLPFGLVVLQMVLFSFAAEKGARYLCVMLPFMACAAAVVLDDAWQRFKAARGWILVLSAVAAAGMVYTCAVLAAARTDYGEAVRFLLERDPRASIISTQPLVEGLYVTDERQILPCPKDLSALVSLYQQGARYLVLDPQAYISWTADGRRFSPPLIDFLNITLKTVAPIKTYDHLNSVLLGRFVLDHNEQILDSLSFLSHASQEGFGKIRIYALNDVFFSLKQAHAAGLI